MVKRILKFGLIMVFLVASQITAQQYGKAREPEGRSLRKAMQTDFVPGELVVKFKDSVTACVHCLIEGRPNKSLINVYVYDIATGEERLVASDNTGQHGLRVSEEAFDFSDDFIVWGSEFEIHMFDVKKGMRHAIAVAPLHKNGEVFGRFVLSVSGRTVVWTRQACGPILCGYSEIDYAHIPAN